LQSVEILSFQLCPKCENEITDFGRTCRRCQSFSALDGLIVTSKYTENNLDRLVHLYKYRFVEDLHVPLGRLLTRVILQARLPIPDIIIPVPLHARRLRWRGFNQSQLLAEYLGQNLTPGFEIPIFSRLLVRRRYTPPQMKIKKYSDRLTNLQNAFEINLSKNSLLNEKLATSSQDLQNKTILLVDDIATTGATLFECAKVLKKNGAKKVFGTVIARQEIKT